MRNLCERDIINHRPRGKPLEHLSLGCTDLACWFVSETYFAGKLCNLWPTSLSKKKSSDLRQKQWNTACCIEARTEVRHKGWGILALAGTFARTCSRSALLERKRSVVWLAAIHFHQRWSCKGSSSALPSLLIVPASCRLPLKVIMQRLTKFWHSGYCLNLGITLWNLVFERC